IYHSMLVYPAMAASARHDKVLIIGGGDGLALRDVLKWNPDNVVLVDLDERIIDFFSEPYYSGSDIINEPLLALNGGALKDPRVEVKIGDAFLIVDQLLQTQSRFDTIIVDLPDPNHPDLNKLYSARFYSKLLHLLAGDGAISVQSTSPFHAPEAFKSIGKTMNFAGFENVEQYHANVPSFGEWGWTIATPLGQPPKQRLEALKVMPQEDEWLSKELILGAFAFGKDFYDDINTIKINRLNSTVLYDYHRQGWARESESIWQ
ncbi:MAG: spermidine synthase, partial [Gammaproteobacteria bacterium]|nr:spermidine synthase [Gammaproteobacteria bacterium]